MNDDDDNNTIYETVAIVLVAIFAFVVFWLWFEDYFRTLKEPEAIVFAGALGLGGIAFATYLNGRTERRKQERAEKRQIIHHFNILQPEVHNAIVVLDSAYNLLGADAVQWKMVAANISRARFTGTTNPDYFIGIKSTIISRIFLLNQQLRAFESGQENFIDNIPQEILELMEIPEGYAFMEDQKIQHSKLSIGKFMNRLFEINAAINAYSPAEVTTTNLERNLIDKYREYRDPPADQ